ncbi:MAG: LLM class flavin-dependent oxidoreductase, partial [Chloroflexi bacterium]|nr:LLM class flavin-dependent oxidoreductase [Chloroflexota bacterium]
PAPVPILVAAGGPAALATAGRSADIVALASGSRQQFVEQVGRLKAAAGDRFERIELAMLAWAIPEGDTAVREISEQMARRLTGRDLDTLAASEAPNLVMGSRDGIVEQLQERRTELGLSYLVFGVQVAQALAPIVERLAGT